MAGRGELTYLELNSLSPRTAGDLLERAVCTHAVLISGGQLDESRGPSEPEASGQPSQIQEGVTTIRADVAELDPASFTPSLCLIRSFGSAAVTVRDARFCLAALRGRGVIVFQNRTLVSRGIRRFLGQLDDCRAYPLTTELFVVELGIPTLLADPAVAARLPRTEWARVSGARRRLIGALALTGMVRAVGAAVGGALLFCGSGRVWRHGAARPQRDLTGQPGFTVHTFVNDESQYRAMCDSYASAGFHGGTFVRRSDDGDEPYQAITRLGQSPDAQYPILCHQDTRLDRGAGAAELWRLLTDLSESDPAWVVAGAAGVTSTGDIIRRFVNPSGPLDTAPSASRVLTLDECFLVFNARNTPQCSSRLSGFHLYGTDVCLQAARHGGTAYGRYCPITHLSGGTVAVTYREAEARLRDEWRMTYVFRYVVSTISAVFISRSRILTRIFSSRIAMACVRLRVQAQR